MDLSMLISIVALLLAALDVWIGWRAWRSQDDD